eukprot:COSAG05_NODE_864_length_6891_cov_387.780330_5_plen_135_part_00
MVVFSCNRACCNVQMTKLDFNTDDEKALVEQVFTNAIDSLSEDDRRLPQIEHILPLLKRGIGMHHSGLLPILKEVSAAMTPLRFSVPAACLLCCVWCCCCVVWAAYTAVSSANPRSGVTAMPVCPVCACPAGLW